MHRSIIKSLIITTLLFLSLLAHAQGTSSTSVVSVDISPKSIQLQGEVTLKVTVTVPPGHHAYLDSGEDGSLLPIEISLSLSHAAVKVIRVSAPKGVWDEKYQATVLRGKGVYEYMLRSPGAVSGEYPITVRSQICNDATGACYFPQTEKVILEIGDGGKPPIITQYTPRAEQPSHGLLVWLLLAFLAGMVLNVMPCVLPVVSIKVLSLVQQAGESPRRMFGMGLAFAAGMMAVFMALAAMAILFGLGWGQHFQSQTFLIIMIGVVFAFALSLFGVYEFALPRAVGSLAEKNVREGFGGAFLKGALATLLATPCSGPFLGSTLAWTLTQPPGVILLIFATLGLGMALPYVVLTAHPAFLKWLPKPGPWMRIFKHIMGLLLLGTVVFLMASLSRQYQLLTAIFLVSLAVGAWIWGRFSPRAATSLGRGIVLVIALLAVAAGAFLSFKMKIGDSHLFTRGKIGDCPLFSWEAFDADRLLQYQREGRSVMLDFTADWCANCRFNEIRVYNSPEVRQLLQKKNVVAMKADLTRESPETAAIRQLMQQLNARSIPLLAVFSGDDPQRPYTLFDLVSKKEVIGILEKLPEK